MYPDSDYEMLKNLQMDDMLIGPCGTYYFMTIDKGENDRYNSKYRWYQVIWNG